MRIAFRLATGRLISVDLDSTDTALDAKTKLAQIMNIDFEKIKLVHKAKALNDSQIISQMKLSNDIPIQIHIVKKQSKSVQMKKPQNLNTNADSVIRCLLPSLNSPIHSDLLKYFNKEKEQPQEKPLCSFLPPRGGQKVNEKPSNYQQLVAYLEELGYERDLCESALAASFYNIERAAEYLMNQNIPKDIYHNVQTLIEERDNSIYCRLDDENDLRITTFEKATTQFSLSVDEQLSLSELFCLGFDKSLVIQVFEACGKDVQVTSSCLYTIHF